MNYNGYNFDFECDKIETESPIDTGESEYNAEKSQYESRFWYGHKPSDPENLNGYGVNNVWVPPIAVPDSLIEIYDRFMLTTRLSSFPLFIGI